MNLKINEIQIIPIKPQGGLVAFASCVINSQFYFGNIAIYTSPSSPDGFRLVYPTKVLKNNIKVNILYPVSKEVGFEIQKRIVREYLELMENLMKGGKENEREQKLP